MRPGPNASAALSNITSIEGRDMFSGSSDDSDSVASISASR